MMKITDDQLIDAIFNFQIRMASTGVLHNFGGGKSVCPERGFWRWYAPSIPFCELGSVLGGVSAGRMLELVRPHFANGRIKWVFNRVLFSVSDEDAVSSLFADARRFWLDVGVPTGVVDGKPQIAVVDEFGDLKDEAVRFLMSRHGKTLGGA